MPEKGVEAVQQGSRAAGGRVGEVGFSRVQDSRKAFHGTRHAFWFEKMRERKINRSSGLLKHMTEGNVLPAFDSREAD